MPAKPNEFSLWKNKKMFLYCTISSRIFYLLEYWTEINLLFDGKLQYYFHHSVFWDLVERISLQFCQKFWAHFCLLMNSFQSIPPHCFSPRILVYHFQILLDYEFHFRSYLTWYPLKQCSSWGLDWNQTIWRPICSNFQRIPCLSNQKRSRGKRIVAFLSSSILVAKFIRKLKKKIRNNKPKVQENMVQYCIQLQIQMRKEDEKIKKCANVVF